MASLLLTSIVQGLHKQPNHPPDAIQFSRQIQPPNPPVKAPRKRPRLWLRIVSITMLLLVAIVIVLGVITVPRVLAFGSTISATQQPPLSTSGDMTTNNRVNLLIMGYGGGVHDGPYLTDSLLVVSLLPQSHHTSLVSIPRDLWLPEAKNKINAIYAIGSNNNQNPVDGGKAITDTVREVTGLDTKYWMTIDFVGFKELINSIDGIDVDVPDSFSAHYPNNDDATKDASWKTVTFEKGTQHMDGNTAIEYARARYVTDNLAEGTDFARSARQQIIIRAVLSKVKEITTWPKMLDVLNALQDTIRTNLSFADLALFTYNMDLNGPQTARIGLGLDNVLDNDPNLSFLVPKGNDWNDWTDVASYVDEHLYK